MISLDFRGILLSCGLANMISTNHIEIDKNQLSSIATIDIEKHIWKYLWMMTV